MVARPPPMDGVWGSRSWGQCCSPSWKLVIQPHRLFGVVSVHKLTGSTELRVCQRHTGDVELLLDVRDFAAFVVMLSFCLVRRSSQ